MVIPRRGGARVGRPALFRFSCRWNSGTRWPGSHDWLRNPCNETPRNGYLKKLPGPTHVPGPDRLAGNRGFLDVRRVRGAIDSGAHSCFSHVLGLEDNQWALCVWLQALGKEGLSHPPYFTFFTNHPPLDCCRHIAAWWRLRGGARVEACPRKVCEQDPPADLPVCGQKNEVVHLSCSRATRGCTDVLPRCPTPRRPQHVGRTIVTSAAGPVYGIHSTVLYSVVISKGSTAGTHTISSE